MAHSAPSGGTWRFNPPPGWPEPEPGWVPPPNWQPDSTWPPAPPNWTFWIPASQAPDAPSRGRRRTVLVGTLVAGVLAVATAVATTLIVLNNAPEPPRTLADWVREVNAVCQRDVGKVEQSFNDTLRQAARLAAEPPEPGATAAAMPGPTEAIDRLAAAFQRLSGDLLAIAFPTNGNRDDRQTLLKVSGDIAAAARSLSTAMSAYQTGSAAAGPFQQASVQLQMIATSSTPAWAATVTRLGLGGCSRALGDGSPVTALPTPAPLGPGEGALIRRLKSSVLVNCAGAADAPPAGVSAAVNCQAVAAGTLRPPLVLQFADGTALTAWIATMTAGLPRGGLPDRDALDEWGYGRFESGMLACRPSGDGSHLIIWTFTQAHVAVVATSVSRQATYSWWISSSRVLVT